jgi:hypothetical protein
MFQMNQRFRLCLRFHLYLTYPKYQPSLKNLKNQ